MTPPRPVTDWMRDFDHNDPRWLGEPHALWREMRGVGGVARTGRYGGALAPLTWAGVRQVASNPDVFSSSQVEIREGRSLPPDFAPPITSDPPHHRAARALLSRHLSASRVAALTPAARNDCRALIAGLEPGSALDAVADYARPAVSRTLARVFGVGAGDIVAFQHMPFEDRLALVRATAASAQAAPGEGLVAHLAQAAQAGEIIGEARLLGHVYLLLIAGLDTTAGVVTAALLHLADNADDAARLRAKPEHMAGATEEFLRAFAPVSTARVATRPAEVQGCPVAAGDKVLLAFGAANRDPSRFADPDRVVLTRPAEPHAAFGFGIHHCAGAKLARMLIAVAVAEWLAGVAGFRRSDDRPLEWTGNGVRALRQLPLTLCLSGSEHADGTPPGPAAR